MTGEYGLWVTSWRRPTRVGRPRTGELSPVLAKRYKLAKAKSLVPPHPTLGDVDSPQALLDYQAAKREHKAEWKKMKV